MIFADRKLYYRVILGLKLTAVGLVLVGLVVVRFFVKLLTNAKFTLCME